MIPLAVPNLTGNEKRYLKDCIDTNFVSSVGEYVTRFEKMVADATGAADAVATSSGTTGIHVALTAVGVCHGDLVIIPSFTFIASANAVRHCGADVWMMDIQSADWCLDPEVVRRQIKRYCSWDGKQLVHNPTQKRIAALMPVYTLGNIPDMELFRSIADEYALPLVVDAACAIGAGFCDSKLAALADLSVLSFNGNKTITCGGGGAVVAGPTDKGREWERRVRHLTTTARVWPDYDFDMVGFNYRMTNIQAAVGCAQMEHLDLFVQRKRYVREFYRKHLQRLEDDGITFFPTTEGSSCWFSGIVLRVGCSLFETKEVCEHLKEKEIEARPFWKPVHLQAPYRKAVHGEMDISEGLWQRIVTLPCSSGITDEELDRVVDTVFEVICGI